jgi:hypothetical protein
MTVRADSGVASILIPKTIQNEIRGLFHFSSPKVFIYKIFAHMRKKERGNLSKFQKVFVCKK